MTGTDDPEVTSLRRTGLSTAVLARVATVEEPFIVLDVTEPGESPTAVFHALRDLCDEGVLRHDHLGYWRNALDSDVLAGGVRPVGEAEAAALSHDPDCPRYGKVTVDATLCNCHLSPPERRD